MDVRFALAAVLLMSGALAACSSNDDSDDAGFDGGPFLVAMCNGQDTDCGCAADTDCTLSLYPTNPATTEQCYCLGCAYNPCTVQADMDRGAGYASYCAQYTGPSGGCADAGAVCQSWTPRCENGRCVAYGEPLLPPDAGT